MSTGSRKTTCLGIVIMLTLSSVCDGVAYILAETSSKNKSFEASSENIVSTKRIAYRNDTCIMKNIDKSVANLSQFTRIRCSRLDGRFLPLELTEDNYLHLRNTSSMYIAPGQYCVTRGNDAKLCPSARTQTLPHYIWRKCCPQNQLINMTDSNSCVPSTVPFRLSVNNESLSFYVVNINDADFSCPVGHSLKKFTTDTCTSMPRFQIFPKNGTIRYETTTGVFLRKKDWKHLDPSRNPSLYCLDGATNPASNCNNDASKSFQQKHIGDVEINEFGRWPINWNDDDGGSNRASAFHTICSNSKGDANKSDKMQHQKMATILLVCVPEDDISPEPANENLSSKTTILAFIWLLTCPLLLGAALGNCCIIQRNVHGCILTCYLLSMFILNILSAIVIVKVGQKYEEKECRPLDFMIKFMYMSTLCWMSSINFGLHKTFRHPFPQPQPVGFRRFCASVVFSLGFPAISVILCYHVAPLYIDQRCENFSYCVLYDPVTIPFYTVPMHVLVLGNFAIFLKTTYNITKLRNEAEDVLHRHAQDHLKSFGLFAKLFLLTGCIWLLRVVLFILQMNGEYFSWYGVMLETVFSVPEVIFPMIVFHHPEFIRWSWNRAPVVSSFISRLNPLFNA